MIFLLLASVLTAQDTLRLAAGVHPGPMVLERSTVLQGEPGSVIRGDGTGTVLTVLGAGSVVRGVRVENSGRSADGDDAGILVRADSVLIEDVVVQDVLFGIYLREARGSIVRRSSISGRAAAREGDRGDGITLYSSPGTLVEDNVIIGVRDGIYFSYSDSAVVRGNRAERMRFGLHYMFSHENRFERNVFRHGAAGAVIMNSRGIAVEHNVFAWNTGSRSYGLLLQTATNPVVRENLFVGNGIGVFFDNVIGGQFEENLVAANWLGLQLYSNSESTSITGNALAANTFDASGGAGEGYAFCVNGRGNHWAAATRGYDLDGDGRLDQPHSAGSPLMELARDRSSLRLFLTSPAASAMEWAERTFPVFRVDLPVDECPLREAPKLEALASLGSAGGDGNGSGQWGAAGALLLMGGAGAGLMRRPRTVRAA
ncbi:MAG TPA: nitrous oxide reductase family maturation protein NosD [Gemmatimonadales bacterium]|nr:nitrous oxide reductase family maturation protein NosD [Gemmatimonadales bacterium]